MRTEDNVYFEQRGHQQYFSTETLSPPLAEEEAGGGGFGNVSRILQVLRIARVMRIFKLARRSVGL